MLRSFAALGMSTNIKLFWAQSVTLHHTTPVYSAVVAVALRRDGWRRQDISRSFFEKVREAVILIRKPAESVTKIGQFGEGSACENPGFHMYMLLVPMNRVLGVGTILDSVFSNVIYLVGVSLSPSYPRSVRLRCLSVKRVILLQGLEQLDCVENDLGSRPAPYLSSASS